MTRRPSALKASVRAVPLMRRLAASERVPRLSRLTTPLLPSVAIVLPSGLSAKLSSERSDKPATGPTRSTLAACRSYR